PFSHIPHTKIGTRSSIGPFARLRPGTRLGEQVRIGNFVELKAAQIEDHAAINHLTYIGDAHIGSYANIGAGTITCNYDGTHKYKTDIGAHAFIGSNTALVAPVTIGAGAYIGSGSVITKNVAPNSLAVARGRQIEKADWALKLQKKK